MKKTLSFIAVLMLLLTSCDNGNINGGRYYGTFHNLVNDQLEHGAISFTYVNNEGGIYFMMNDLGGEQIRRRGRGRSPRGPARYPARHRQHRRVRLHGGHPPHGRGR